MRDLDVYTYEKGIEIEEYDFNFVKLYQDYRQSPLTCLANMRDLDVYTSEKRIEIEEYDFNFVKLYQDYRQSPLTCLEEENSKRFLNFVSSTGLLILP